MKSTILALFFVLIFASSAVAWPGIVISVQDGDTITVEREDGARERIRLFGVDCPESAWKGRWESQPYSRKATEFVRALLRADEPVEVAIWEMGESYNRIVGGVITLRDGKTVQEELVRAGLAWVDPRFCKTSIRECKNWFALEQEAARERRGLWKEIDGKHKPVAPWEWRKKSGGTRGDE